MQATKYDRSRPTVIIMEQEQQRTRALLVNFIKYTAVSMTINLVLSTVAYILMKSYVLCIINAINVIGIAIYMIINTTQQVNIGNIFRIANDADRVINETEVFDATRLICEMRGFIKGSIRTLKFFHIINASVTIALSISKLIEFFKYEYF